MAEVTFDWYDKLYDYHMQCRHYNDEYKAYEKESYKNFMGVMREAFRRIYRVNLENGDVTKPAGYTADGYKEMLAQLQDAEAKLVKLHDPKEDQIPLWDGQNIPWDYMTKEDWMEHSYDAEDFVPHLVPFLQNDGEKHPAVICMAGSTRLNLPEAYPPAEFFQAHGYQAFVLNNRIAHSAAARKSMNRAMDLQRAIRYVRHHAEELNVDPEHIFIMCCSLGNRAAIDMINTLGIRKVPSQVDPLYLPDDVDRDSAAVSGYISLYPATFLYDNKFRFKDFPPVFAVMGNEDRSLWRMMPFFNNLIMNEVPVELHMYDGAGHGFSLADEEFALGKKAHADAAYKEWTHLLLMWLERRMKLA